MVTASKIIFMNGDLPFVSNYTKIRTFNIIFESFDTIISCFLKKDVSFGNVDLTTIIRKIDFKKRPGKK